MLYGRLVLPLSVEEKLGERYSRRVWKCLYFQYEKRIYGGNGMKSCEDGRKKNSIVMKKSVHIHA